MSLSVAGRLIRKALCVRKALSIGVAVLSCVTQANNLSEHIDQFIGKPRVFVLTDMGNEPDDQMSFVRFLLYSNELDVEGLVATTSTFQKDKTHPETLTKIINAYSEIRPNLQLHASGWPTADHLLTLVNTGQPSYGMASVGDDKLSAGAQALIHAADKNDPRPLWINVWGGANTLAQALHHVQATRPADQLDQFVSRLRVYSISDQDDAGPWIRQQFPGLFYIVSPSTPDGAEFRYATWTGISGDGFYRNGDGADSRLVSNEWLQKHIRSKGKFGSLYPEHWFIMEGDTPAFLHLIPNGLNAFRNPSWGGWGGRYLWRQPSGEPRAIWTQGGDLFYRINSEDTVTGIDGHEYTSDQATIWRWREAFQHDFAARMDWTLKPFNKANHPPVPNINGDASINHQIIAAQTGETLTLDASYSTDADGDRLSYQWFHYQEAGFSTGKSMADLSLKNADKPVVTVSFNSHCRPPWLPQYSQCNDTGEAHVILAVTDNGTPALTRYKRVIFKVTAANP